MATPEELKALANRIDHEELWRWPGRLGESFDLAARGLVRA